MRNYLKQQHDCLFTHVKQWISVCLVLCLFPLALYAQNRGITLNLKEVTLENAVTQISSQAGVSVAYSKEFVDTKQLVSISVKNASLKDALDHLLKKTSVGYTLSGNKLYLFDKKTEQKASPEKKVKVSGRITEQATAEPMVGVSIFVKGGNEGTITDIDGNYSIEVDPKQTLVFSFIGYETKEVTVGSKTNISIHLVENTQVLDDVVVVGYGVQKKVNLTGAVSMVKGEALENRPITNVGTGLQGLLPGVTITSSSGQPGAAPDIKIRGISTINSSTAPLILIDGVAGGDMNLLNPGDIESVSVLKDAASASIYGARAANGVILITTKKGKEKEKSTLTYSGYLGLQTPTALPKLVNGREYMELANEAMAAAGFSRPYDETAFYKYDSGMFPNEYSNTNWIDEIYKKNALQTGHTLSIKGGSEKSSYFMSYGYLDQDGLIVGDSFKSKRHNARISVNTELFDRLKLNGNVSFVDYYRSTSGLSGTSGVFRLAQRMSPLLPIKWKEETGDSWIDTDHWSYGMVKNPLYVAYGSGTEQRKSRVLNAIASADLKIIDGLNLGGQYAANYYFRETDEFNPVMPQYYVDGTPSSENENLRNYVFQEHRNILTQSLQLTLNYKKTVKLHEMSALLGFSQEWEEYSDLNGSRKNILLDGIYVLDAGTEDITNGGNKYSWALRSYFGRINYAYDEKYLFEANMRIDGTSRFAKNNRWGYFPSFSLGWNFARENFMKFASPTLNSGKFRASWGELGNQNVGSNYYPYLTPIERIEKSYPIGGLNNIGFSQNKLGNENIKWETIRMFNIGVDLSFFNNRLTTSFDWFKKQNVDALVQPVYPTIVGITGSANLPYENMGEIENKGWEWDISWRDQIGQVKYNVAFNLSDSKNKITDLGRSAATLGDKIRRIGDPIDAYYGYLTDGLAQTSDFGEQNEAGKYINPHFAIPKASESIVQPGDIKYRDISGPDGKPDGVIDDYDKVVFGEPYPHYTFSFKGALEWKGIDFSFYLQGVGKVNGYLKDEARHSFINDYSVPKVEHLDRWTPNNPGASYPRLYQSQTHNLLFSDYWLENAAYLRLKNIQIGYRLPKKWTNPLGISNLRIYASADNLLTFTKYFGAYDPEVRESSGDSYPQVKTYVFGLVVSF